MKLLFTTILLAYLSILSAQHANDVPATALPISFGQSVTMNNIGAIDEGNTPTPSCIGSVNGTADVYGIFTTSQGVSKEVTLDFTFIETDLDLTYQIILGSNMTEIGCFSGGNGGETLNLLPNTTYYIRLWDLVYSNQAPEEGNFDFNITEIEIADPYNIPSTALPIPFGHSVTMNNIGAIDEADGMPDPTCGLHFLGIADVYGVFTTSQGVSSEVAFDFTAIDAGLDLRVQVIDVNTNTQNACFGANTAINSILSLPPNTTYYIRFWDSEFDNGGEPEYGSFEFTLIETITPHIHDLPSTAMPLTFGQSFTMNNIGAIDEADGMPDPTCGLHFLGIADVYGVFTTSQGVSSEVTFDFTAIDAGLDLRVQIIDAGTQNGCLTASTGINSTLIFSPNTTYYIRFWDSEFDNGSEPEYGSFEFTFIENIVLPIELISFQANKQNNAIALNWQTTTELNNQGFNLQKSEDGRVWETIAFIDGQGTTDIPQSYQYIDNKPFDGINYYRLEQIDYDGTTNYSEVISSLFTSGNQNQNVTVFPNPANDLLNINFSQEGTQIVQVFDMIGRLQIEQTINETNTQIDISSLPEGLFTIRFNNSISVIFSKK